MLMDFGEKQMGQHRTVDHLIVGIFWRETIFMIDKLICHASMSLAIKIFSLSLSIDYWKTSICAGAIIGSKTF